MMGERKKEEIPLIPRGAAKQKLDSALNGHQATKNADTQSACQEFEGFPKEKGNNVTGRKNKAF